MAISERVSKLIWGQCAARCCICREQLVHQSGGGRHSLIGEIAHIVGATEAKPRGISRLTRGERNEAENLFLLCRPHHKIVDDDQVTHTVESLLAVKAQHLDWISTQLVRNRPWQSPISQLSYINVPRLCEQAEMKGISVDLSSYEARQTLHSLGWNLNRLMSAFQSVLSQLHLEAVPIAEVTVHEAFIGTAISFDRQRFRTKNVPMLSRSASPPPTVFTGSLTTDPHIYARVGEAKIVLNVDPRWITTSTAMTLFRPSSGQSIFSGIGKVTAVDYETNVVTVTPWALGLPRGIWELLSDLSEPSRSTARQLDLDSSHPELESLVNLKRAHEDPCHFSPPPNQCDLCSRSFVGEHYMIDGAVRGLGGWACMCAGCFSTRGRKIGWGDGQLYICDSNGWLLVAGFPPPEATSSG